VRRYTLALGLKIGAHALRATAATNALDHEADIAKVQEWLGHANIATTRILRSAEDETRRLTDVQGKLLKTVFLQASKRAEVGPVSAGDPATALRTRNYSTHQVWTRSLARGAQPP
jgi:hypothetical protein